MRWYRSYSDAVITQIYTAQTPDEAVALAEFGVDHVGVTVSERGLPGEVDMSIGREIVEALESSPARCVALTVETDPTLVRDFLVDLRPDIVHLCGDTSLLGPGDVFDLRRWMVSNAIQSEVMQAIPMIGPGSVELAIEFATHVDWLILDSVAEAVDGIGAAGVTHDWNMSRQIVETVGVPVILAGGLGPENVADAIRIVRPAGVDSLTLTNHYRSDNSFSKDLEAVGLFVESARRAVL